MIDDYYHICEELSNNGITALYYYMAGRKAEDSPNLITVNNWGEIYRVITEITSNPDTNNK